MILGEKVGDMAITVTVRCSHYLKRCSVRMNGRYVAYGGQVTGHGFCEKMVLRQGVESGMKVAWRDGLRKRKFVG